MPRHGWNLGGYAHAEGLAAPQGLRTYPPTRHGDATARRARRDEGCSQRPLTLDRTDLDEGAVVCPPTESSPAWDRRDAMPRTGPAMQIGEEQTDRSRVGLDRLADRRDVYSIFDQVLQRPRQGLIAHDKCPDDCVLVHQQADSIDLMPLGNDPSFWRNTPGLTVAARIREQILTLAPARRAGVPPPITTAVRPRRASLRIWRASSRLSSLTMLARSPPGKSGVTAVEPVASRSRSKVRCWLLDRMTSRVFGAQFPPPQARRCRS